MILVQNNNKSIVMMSDQFENAVPISLEIILSFGFNRIFDYQLFPFELSTVPTGEKILYFRRLIGETIGEWLDFSKDSIVYVYAKSLEDREIIRAMKEILQKN